MQKSGWESFCGGQCQSSDFNFPKTLCVDVNYPVSVAKPKNNLWRVQESWGAIPAEQCQRLVDSINNRHKGVIKNNGHAKKNEQSWNEILTKI